MEFRTHRGTVKLTSEKQHRWMHARLKEGDKAGDHTHYTGKKRGKRHAI